MDQRTLCPRYVFFCGTTISRNAGDDCWPNGTGVCAGAHFAKVTGYLYFVKNVCDKIDARHHQILVAGADNRLIWKCIVFFFNRENEMCPMNHFLVFYGFFSGKNEKIFLSRSLFPKLSWAFRSSLGQNFWNFLGLNIIFLGKKFCNSLYFLRENSAFFSRA